MVATSLAYIAGDKQLTPIALSTALSLGSTAYTFALMLPMNYRMMELAEDMKPEAEEGNKDVKELRALQSRWTALNYGRSLFMIGSAIVMILYL